MLNQHWGVKQHLRVGCLCSEVTLPFTTVHPAVEHYIFTHATFQPSFSSLDTCGAREPCIVYLYSFYIFVLHWDYSAAMQELFSLLWIRTKQFRPIFPLFLTKMRQKSWKKVKKLFWSAIIMHSTWSLVKIYNKCLNNNSTITSFVIINKFKQMDCFATTVFHGIFFSFFGRSGSCLSISVSCFCFTRVLHLRKESTKLGSLIHLLNIWKDLAFLVACLWNINMDIQLLSIGIWSQTCFKSVYYVCLVG